jgi:hypothetical protein
MYIQYYVDVLLLRPARTRFPNSDLEYAVLCRARICCCRSQNDEGFGVIWSSLVEEYG